MDRQIGPGRFAPFTTKDDDDKPRHRHQGVQNSEPAQDIARIARSLGFSRKEVVEIERLYLSTTDGTLK